MLNAKFPVIPAATSLHNHSTFSDGASSLEDVCRAGKAGGLKLLGISDHWVMPAYDDHEIASWRMKPERLDEYVDSLLKLKKELEDDNFSLKIGLEVDFFFENMDEIFAHLSQYPLDYLIGSVHCCGTFPVDHDAADWLPLSQEERDAVCEMYWKKLEGAAAREEFLFLGHLDLPKKFALLDNGKYFDHACRVLDILQQHNGAIELNTSGWFKPCNEAYPSPDIIRAAHAREIPIYLNADAHHADHLQRNFNEAAGLLELTGYKYRA